MKKHVFSLFFYHPISTRINKVGVMSHQRYFTVDNHFRLGHLVEPQEKIKMSTIYTCDQMP